MSKYEIDDDDLLEEKDDEVRVNPEDYYVPEDDPAFSPPEGGNGEEFLDEEEEDDDPAFKKKPGNPIISVLAAIGYYNPKTRKTAVMIVAAATACILVLLMMNMKKRDGTSLIDISVKTEKVSQDLGTGESGDKLDDESMMNMEMTIGKSNTTPGHFAERMFRQGEDPMDEELQKEEYRDDVSEEMTVNPAAVKENTPSPERAMTRAERREQNLRELFGEETPSTPVQAATSSSPAQTQRSTPAQRPTQQQSSPAKKSIAETYGVSPEAIRAAGLTPEQFESILAGAGGGSSDPLAGVNIEKLQEALVASSPNPVAAAEVVEAALPEPDPRIPKGTAPVRRSNGIQSLNSEVWGQPGRLSSLEEETYMATDDDHPFKVMFCRNEKVRSGQKVSLRLLEDMVVGNTLIQANTHLDAVLTVGQRIGITVNSIEVNGRIIPLDFIGYDNDGGQGLYCPVPENGNIIQQGVSEAGNILRTIAMSGMGAVGSIPGQVLSSGTSLIQGKGGSSAVSVTSGYTFYLLKKKH